MKKLSKSIKKYLADNIPMNKPKHEGQGRQNHPQLAAHGWNDNDAKIVCMQLGYSGNG